MQTTLSCAPLGDGICDGYLGSAEDDAPDHHLCACWCHNVGDLPPTVQSVRAWHDRHHGVEITRLVRDGLRQSLRPLGLSHVVDQ
jgi:hypothetical protein